MSRKVFVAAIFICSLMLFCNVTFADNSSIKVFVDNNQVQFDVQPFISNNRVLVPFRVTLENLGAEVGWDESTQTVSAKKAGKTIFIKINDEIAYVDGKKVEIDVAATIKDGRTFVPIRFISESLGAEVNWDNNTKTISINSLSPIQVKDDTILIQVKDDTILKRKISDNNISLIDKRLFIKMPYGAKEESIGHGIMSAASSNHKETKIALEVNGEKLVVYAKEMLLYSSGDIESDAKKLMETDEQEKVNYTLSKIKSDKDFSVIKILPNKPDLKSEVILVQGAIVKSTDNTLISIQVYVTPDTFKDKEGCIKLSDDILDTIQVGTRSLDTSLHKEKILGNTCISIQKDYVLTEQYGTDFSVYYITKVTQVGNVNPCMGIYIGGFPSSIIPQDISADKLKKMHGNIMNKKIEWVCYNPKTDVVNSDSVMETMLTIPELSSYSKIHIFVNPTNSKNLQEMKEMAESLTSTK